VGIETQPQGKPQGEGFQEISHRGELLTWYM